MAVRTAVWAAAVRQYTTILAHRYPDADRPAACSRRKMVRSPTRSRIVNAVPMKTALMLSSVMICAGSLGSSPRGLAMPRPALPGTTSVSAARMNGSSAKNAK